MEQYSIYTKQLTVGYDGTPLISDINIQLNPGEILTLIGPNGGGKSTILKTFTRQLSAVAGTIYLCGDDMGKLSDAQISQRLSMVMTDRITPELMTCQDVVATGRYPYTGRLGILGDADRLKVWEALKMVQAEEFAKRPFYALSDGQRQRIMLARAICQEPEIMILDEPTSYLDIKHKLELVSILKKLVHDEKLVVVMSVHELDLAQKISDTVVCVCKDHIHRVGTPEEIFEKQYIEALYGVSRGSYDVYSGAVELAPVKGKPKVFVIGGGGSGICLYRKLQRKAVPFAAGILQENDLDYPTALALAETVISVPAFASMTKEAYTQACRLMRSCGRVVCCLDSFGETNEMNHKLYETARAEGLLTENI